MTGTTEDEREEQGIDWLVSRLAQSGRYEYIRRHNPYSVRLRSGAVLRGEEDVDAKVRGSSVHHYYEWKNHTNDVSYRKAERQAARAYRAFGENIKVIYVTPDTVRRL